MVQEMPHHVDPTHAENVPHWQRSYLDKGTELHHEILNILTANEKNEKMEEKHENSIRRVRTWSHIIVITQ